MEALIMILKNEKTGEYHPILYFEHFFPGGSDAEINQNIIRYKSKGHRTNGFKDREDAVNSIDKEIVPGCDKLGYHLNRETEIDLFWDGEDMPLDNQLRERTPATTPTK